MIIEGPIEATLNGTTKLELRNVTWSGSRRSEKWAARGTTSGTVSVERRAWQSTLARIWHQDRLQRFGRYWLRRVDYLERKLRRYRQLHGTAAQTYLAIAYPDQLSRAIEMTEDALLEAAGVTRIPFKIVGIDL